MTDLIDVIQKQDPGSGLVELFELVIDSTTTVYFHSGVDDDAAASKIKFRDKTPIDSVYTEREYVAIPIKLTGIDKQADGASPRPSLTVANILAVFSDSIGITNNDLIGKRLLRRTTLKKYLVDESADTVNTGPPIEFPTEKFIIDRIGSESKESITFELAAASDLQGLKLPSRIVVGKYCGWEYQGEGGATAGRGGCNWPTDSTIPRTSSGTTTDHKAYFTIDDEPICLYSAVSGVIDTSYVSTQEYGKDNWVKTGSGADTKYWRSDIDPHTGNTPSNTSLFWTRIRTYTAWTNGSAYTYDKDEPVFVESGNTIWRIIRDTPAGNTPVTGSSYWVRGDVCGKILNSCKIRYQFVPDHVNSGVSAPNKFPSERLATQIVLPFGGFPGSEKYR